MRFNMIRVNRSLFALCALCWPLTATAQPLPSTPSWSVGGTYGSVNLGCSVASAGDVDGDGYDDVIAGARFWEQWETDEGAAFLYLGGAVGPPPAPDWSVESDQAYAYMGESVASAGDVDGDGYDDVLVGAYTWDGGLSDEGAAFLYLGGPTGPSPAPDWSVESDQASAQLGGSVASAGDVNGDGYDDVLAGAMSWGSSDAGGVFAYASGGAGWWTDLDGDGVSDTEDDCLYEPDPDQLDADADGAGDVCDRCPDVFEPFQIDSDGDGDGDACDPCPYLRIHFDTDGDGDPVCTDCDNGDAALTSLDADADSVSSCSGDCNDADAGVHPAAAETWNGIDDDCDGIVDELTLTSGAWVLGYPVDLTLTGAPPFTRVSVARTSRLVGPAACPPAIAPLCLDLAAPAVLVGSARSDVTGVAELGAQVPLGPVHVEIQAYTSTGLLSDVVSVHVHLPGSDFDADGLTAGDEVALWGTDPGLADTDGGGASDGDEVAAGSDPLVPLDDPA